MTPSNDPGLARQQAREWLDWCEVTGRNPFEEAVRHADALCADEPFGPADYQIGAQGEW